MCFATLSSAFSLISVCLSLFFPLCLVPPLSLGETGEDGGGETEERWRRGEERRRDEGEETEERPPSLTPLSSLYPQYVLCFPSLLFVSRMFLPGVAFFAQPG
jgi:hypothetical protein